MSGKNFFKISRSFADALFFSLNKNETDVKDFVNILEEIAKTDIDDLISIYQKDNQVFLSLFDDLLNKNQTNILRVVLISIAETKNLKLLPQISLFFKQRVEEFLGQQRLEVIVANLKNTHIVEDYLKSNNKGEKFIISFKEDISLIAGFKINFINENKVIDMSMSGVLSRI